MRLVDGYPQPKRGGAGDRFDSTGSTVCGEESTGDSCRLRLRVHSRLLETLDLANLGALKPATVSAKVNAAIGETVDNEGRLLTDIGRARLVGEIKHELRRLGQLEPLLRDDTVSEILVNGPSQVYVQRDGKLHRTEVAFQNNQHLMVIIDRLLAQAGRRIDEASPMVDARLPDGSLINAIIAPLSLGGPSLSIRRFRKAHYGISSLVAQGLLTSEMARFFEAMVKARLNILVCGGAGSGKTTLLNCLSGFIPNGQRIVTIENSAELTLPQPHVVRLQAREADADGKGEVTQRDLVRNSLRMRPDRIIVGDLRGAEVLDLLQAMSSGHEGALATIHAHSVRESLARLEALMQHAGCSIPQGAIRYQIATAINVVIHLAQLSDGSRKVMRVSEIKAMEGDTMMMQDLFEFVLTETASGGAVSGDFRASGICSAYADQLEAAGLKSGDSIEPQSHGRQAH